MAAGGEVLVTGDVVARLGEDAGTVSLGAREVRGFPQAIEVARLR
jgi:class 3 adenylate cyclase